MANRATTSSVVRLNQKIENTEVFRLAPPADGTLISEGRFVAYDTTTKRGRLGTATDRIVFLNWVDSDRSDVDNTQVAPMANLDHAAAVVRIETGGLAGIIGQMTLVGLPASLVARASGSPTAGDFITCGASGVVTAKAPANVGGAGAAAADVFTFGTILMSEAGIVWFLFHSASVAYDMA